MQTPPSQTTTNHTKTGSELNLSEVRMILSIVRTILYIVAAFGFMLVFYPGPYSYHNTYNNILVRVNRLTGSTAYYVPGGWVPDQPATIPAPTLSLDALGRPATSPTMTDEQREVLEKYRKLIEAIKPSPTPSPR
jgi:hypothetical protein